MPIMAEATPSTLQVKLNGSRTPVMTNPSMWEGNKLSTSLMDILLLSSVGQSHVYEPPRQAYRCRP